MRYRWWSSVSMHGTHLAHTFRYSNFSVKVLPMVLQETLGTKMQRSSRVILRSWRMICSTFVTLSSKIDGLPLLSSSWIPVRPAVNSLHHLRTFLTSMHDSPYTSVNWRWISIGSTPFAFKNRITAQTSHLAGAASGSSISNSCRAKTERLSGLSDGLFGSGGTNKHSSVANSHVNSFPAAPALWRPYFWDHPHNHVTNFNSHSFVKIVTHQWYGLQINSCIQHSEDCASLYILTIKPTRSTDISDLFLE